MQIEESNRRDSATDAFIYELNGATNNEHTTNWNWIYSSGSANTVWCLLSLKQENQNINCWNIWAKAFKHNFPLSKNRIIFMIYKIFVIAKAHITIYNLQITIHNLVDTEMWCEELWKMACFDHLFIDLHSQFYTFRIRKQIYFSCGCLWFIYFIAHFFDKSYKHKHNTIHTTTNNNNKVKRVH